MNSKLRNTVVASLAVVLGSLALALNNTDLVTYLDYGAYRVSSRVQQEVRLVSATPIFVGSGAGGQAEQASKLELRRRLERLGIQVD